MNRLAMESEVKKLEGKRVVVSYVYEGRVQTCAGELEWSRDLQQWVVVRDDRNVKDYVAFFPCDIQELFKANSKTAGIKVGPGINIVYLVGLWRLEKVKSPDNPQLIGYQIVKDDADANRVVLAECFPRPYPVEVCENHMALMAASAELYAAAKGAVTALDKSNAAMYISGLNVNQLRLAVEKAERIGV